jgi:hypothetical protein
MQLSDNTIKVLKNCSAINPSILMKEGDLIRTISPQKNVLAEFVVDQPLDGKMCIYDINSFLNMLSLFDSDYDIKIDDKKAVVKDGNNKGTFFFAHEDTIETPPEKNLKLENALAEFDLSDKIISKAKKAASTLNAEDFVLAGDGKKVVTKVTNRHNNTANHFNQDVGETDQEFEVVIDVSKLTFLPGDYKVSVYEKVVFFHNDAVKYWIACK